jgi:hypothetical protein
MKQQGKFRKVSRSEKRMYGPRALLICGYPEEEHASLLEMLEGIGLSGFPVIFATSRDLETAVGDLLNSGDRAGLKEPSPMQRALIMSGMTQNDLHTLMGAYRQSGLPKQLWASLTPVSESWTLGALLKELEKESQQMRKKEGPS